ncbi:SDR family oxidoreductase [Sneathiella chinensis]|uniref:3-oxoacyl-ACP reductase n=1 Tax=Sneathiella chinensis TaxID=349750 RepID=A0ABQ5U3W2_9PROT|nr:SDR family oxidoreductase [Sneathiella chinensis]GLQ06518.1 3-oxoacyl-ACP reductase [Sneathiella chinensis]
MLNNKIILMTDATHFLGTPGTKALLAEGATVYAQDASFEAEAARQAFEAALPGAVALAEQEPAEVVSAVVEAAGRIDVLINNDAYPAVRAPIDEADVDEFRKTLDALMVRGFAYAHAVAPGMKQAGRGKIIFVSSAAPKHGLPNYSMYVAARGGTNALAVSLSRELGRFGIQVNALAPNFVESPTYFPDDLLANPDAMKKITGQIPLGRLGKPEEAGDYLVFLASDKSDFITGQVLYFAGGWA